MSTLSTLSTLSTRARLTTAASLAVLSAAAFALPAAAAGPAPAEPDDDRVAALCERVPAARDRIQGLIERIEAGDDTPGSLEWLRMRVGRAEGKGRMNEARMLEHRAERRTDRLEHLGSALERLDAAEATYCADLR